jgi:hypothetical protein
MAGDNLEVDTENPNIVRAVPPVQDAGGTGRNASSDAGDDEYDIIEGSDSERTGTSWGLPGMEAAEVQTPSGTAQEGEDADEAHPNRNTGDRLTRDELQNVGSWSTIDTDDTAGSPSGFS